MAASAPTSATKPKKRNLLTTANGKKLVMAVTGLALCGFLFFHLAGNLLLLQGGGWFNNYATVLNAIPFLLIIELGLAAIVFLHAWEGYTVWKGNKAARGDQEYHYKEWTKAKKSSKSKKSVASTTMMVTGIILLVFMVGHVWHFKYHNSIGPANPISKQKAGESAEMIAGTSGKQETKQETLQLAQHVVLEIQKPYVLVLYLLSMAAVGLHLYHAVGSSLQTLGAGGTKFGQGIWYLGRAFAAVIGGAFFILPLWIYFFAEVPIKKNANADATKNAPAQTAPTQPSQP